MENKIIRVNINNPVEFSEFQKTGLDFCTNILSRGGIIVFPTETLYGLGVDINNAKAIDRLIDLKGRPPNMPIAVAVANLEQAGILVEVTEKVKKFIIGFMPNPVTLLLPVKPNVNPILTGGSPLIGLRFPDDLITRVLLERFGPITATSANIHGSKNPIKVEDAMEQLGDQVNLYIDTGPCKVGKPSTVVDISGDTIKIIRDGACSGEELERFFRNI